MGEMPRSQTGLVPRCGKLRINQDSLSSPLPPKPSRELYRYRGDFINARNQKLAAKKTEERKANLDATRKNATSNNIECSSTTAIPPCSPRESPTQGNVGWNANYKHNSFQLTPDEQQKQAENKNKFTDFLRIEACKRHARAAGKKEIAVKPQDEKETVPKRKPFVPRLSALALARAQGKKYTPKSINHRSVTNSSGKSTMTNKPNVENVGAKNKEGGNNYLDFISRKQKASEPSMETTTHTKVGKLKEPISNTKQPVLADDDSIFRIQLERIVQRASDLVVEKQQRAKSSDETTDSSPSTVVPTEDKRNDIQPRVKTKNDMRNRHDRLGELEMRLARISGSSFMGDDDDDDDATITEQPSDETSSCSSNTEERPCSVGTEVIPRRAPMPMHPLNMNAQDLPRRAQWTSLYYHLHNDSSDDSSTNIYSDTTSMREQLLWQGPNESVDACPSQPSVVEPSILPTRQFDFEDEPPRPRGHCHGSFDVSESLVEEDFFSLFG